MTRVLEWGEVGILRLAISYDIASLRMTMSLGLNLEAKLMQNEIHDRGEDQEAE